MLVFLTTRWPVVLARGIACVLVGVLSVLWPGPTLWTLIVLFGAFAAADGLAALWLGFSARANGRVWWEMVLLGAAVLLAGAAALAWPGLTAVVFVTWIGVSALVRGALEISAAIQLRKVLDDEWLMVLSGGVSILFGAILLTKPAEAALALLLLIGAWMIVVGVMLIGLALRLRSLGRRLDQPQPR